MGGTFWRPVCAVSVEAGWTVCDPRLQTDLLFKAGLWTPVVEIAKRGVCHLGMGLWAEGLRPPWGRCKRGLGERPPSSTFLALSMHLGGPSVAVWSLACKGLSSS